jgi:hypothetical protein
LQKTAGTLLHRRIREVGSMLQLQLRKKNLKEEEPGMLLKRKNNVENFILSHPSLALSPSQNKFG